MGPATLFDKSFLQALNRDEAAIFDALFRANITPLFFAETLADLEGGMRGGQSPSAIVENLAAKTPVLHSAPVASHLDMALGDLLGSPAPMDGRPAISGGRCVVVDGKRGIVFDEMPEMQAFNRWQKGDFLGVERLFAKDWRAALQAMPRDVEAIVGVDGKALKLRDLSEVKAYVDDLVEGRGRRWGVLSAVMELLGLPSHARRAIAERWKQSGRPPLTLFAPYAAHFLTVELFFQVAAATGKIALQRPSNRIDVAYLHYLPCSELFVSGDKLHERIAPLFLRPNQRFVRSADLKSGLTALDGFYSSHPDIETEGLMRVASWPPVDGDFMVGRIFDEMLPHWRKRASQPPVEVSPETNARIAAEVKAYQDKKRAKASARPFHVDEAESLVLTRLIPLRRGKYQFMPASIKPDRE